MLMTSMFKYENRGNSAFCRCRFSLVVHLQVADDFAGMPSALQDRLQDMPFLNNVSCVSI